MTDFSNDSNIDKIIYNKDNNSGSMYMRVTLIEERSAVYILSLPDIVDGRYKFREYTHVDKEIPVYIEGKNGQWILHLIKDAMFFSNERENDFSEKILYDKMSLNIYYNERKFFLFAEIDELKNTEFLFYQLKENTEYSIGRLSDNHIHYPFSVVSRKHALLRWKNGSWYIIDNKSKNGTFLNGHVIESAKLCNGDFIFIAGLHILVGHNFIAINNSNGRVNINTSNIHQIYDDTCIEYSEKPMNVPKDDLFDRQPHKQLNNAPAKAGGFPCNLKLRSG